MARMIKCKYCGEEIPKSAKRCPNCNKKVKHPIATAFAVIILVIALLFIFLLIVAPKDTSTTDTTTTETTAAENKQVVLVDDENITAEFLGFDDYPDLGAFYVTIRVTNKTDQKIWVYLEDASVNDEMMSLVMSGAPLNILPEKKGTNSFIFPYQQISIDKFDAVETVSFKIAVKDEESLADIETTAEVTITK